MIGRFCEECYKKNFMLTRPCRKYTKTTIRLYGNVLSVEKSTSRYGEHMTISDDTNFYICNCIYGHQNCQCDGKGNKKNETRTKRKTLED